jgi:hypothetical protein
LVGEDEGRPLAGHLGCLGGGEGEVVFGDVEEFGRVFCAVFVGDGCAGAFVAKGGVEVLAYLSTSESINEHYLPI